MIKLSGEGLVKAERGDQSYSSCSKQQNCESKGKVLEGDKKCYSSEHINDKKAKQPYC